MAKVQWYIGESPVVHWRKSSGTLAKVQWYIGESPVVHWRKSSGLSQIGESPR
ncbi:unnamed protein product, partial [Rotaria sp. Silwood2]